MKTILTAVIKAKIEDGTLCICGHETEEDVAVCDYHDPSDYYGHGQSEVRGIYCTNPDCIYYTNPIESC